MFKVLTKFPRTLEDKSIEGVSAIVEINLPHVKGNLTFDLPPSFDDKSFAETLTKCEEIFYDEKYKDKAQFEKMTELSAKTSTGSQSLMEVIYMIIKLFATEVYYGNTTWSQFLKKEFSEYINNKVKAQLAIMCDEEHLASTGSQSLMELINILYKKGTLTDEDFMALI